MLEAQRFYLDTRRRAVEALNDASAAIPELERVVGLPLREIEKVCEKPGESGTVPVSQEAFDVQGQRHARAQILSRRNGDSPQARDTPSEESGD